jgi:hypothetical protein
LNQVELFHDCIIGSELVVVSSDRFPHRVAQTLAVGPCDAPHQWENKKMRALTAGLALCLVTAPALAASPKVESAIKVYKAVAANPAKLKAFCDMSKVIKKLGDKEDAAAEAQIDRYMGQLGADFQTAWEAGDGVDENSPDGKALYAAIDDLEGKCPR